MTRIITGLFKKRGDAERVVEHLVQEFSVSIRTMSRFMLKTARSHVGRYRLRSTRPTEKA
jgi:hypothetical protein